MIVAFALVNPLTCQPVFGRQNQGEKANVEVLFVPNHCNSLDASVIQGKELFAARIPLHCQICVHHFEYIRNLFPCRIFNCSGQANFARRAPPIPTRSLVVIMGSGTRAAAFVPALGRTLRISVFTPSFSVMLNAKQQGNSASTRSQRTLKISTSAVLGKPTSKPPDRTPPRPDRLSTRKTAFLPEDDEDVCFVDECEETYRLPPPEIAQLVDATVDPTVSLQPASKEWIIFLERPNLPPIAEVCAEELRLAGFRINANTYAPSHSDYYIGMSMQRIGDPKRLRVPVTGLPAPSDDSPFLEFGHVRWAPDGKRFAFCVYDPLVGLELWVVRADTRHAVCALPGVRLNAVCGDPFTWNADSETIIAKFVLEDRAIPVKPGVPRGPMIQENLSSKPAPSRTFQDLLKSRHDRRLFDHYATCQLGLVNVETNERKDIGVPSAFRRASPSPDGRFMLIDVMIPPFPYMMPAGRFPRKVEVWDSETGKVATVVAEIPLQDKIPIAFDGVGEGPRGIAWRADVDATLYWAEAQDGGDPNKDVEVRDCLYTLSAPFTRAPRKLASLRWRYSGIVWGSDSIALLSERRYKSRSMRSYMLAPGPVNYEAVADEEFVPDATADGPCCARACDLSQGEAPKRLVFDIANWEDRYNDPGSVCTKRSRCGKSVLRLIYPNGSEVDDAEGTIGRPFLVMQGAGASDEGDRPFLSFYDTVTKSTTKIWQSQPPHLQSIVLVLKEDERTRAPLKVLIRQEGEKENPNFFIHDMESKSLQATEELSKNSEDGNAITNAGRNLDVSKEGVIPNRALTDFRHPAPKLIDVQREIVNYERADGVRLNGSLYLPPSYNSERDGPLPVLIWAYPREYKSAKFAGQMRGSPYRFVRLARTPLYWLTRGYAILDGPEMPIIGEGEIEANDSYIEQLVMSAEAAVDFLVKRGIGQRGKMAIGGHSYGAFMTVNVMAHAPKLFCCGIARSGAYNRTLTPFGFQSEERTLWEAQEVYQNMSPYMFADKIESPLLLIHGDSDNNPGTFPMQSERMYQALRGHGKLVRFVTLPYEGHGYRARESVMHVLAEMTVWLDKYCKGVGDNYMSEI